MPGLVVVDVDEGVGFGVAGAVVRSAGVAVFFVAVGAAVGDSVVRAGRGAGAGSWMTGSSTGRGDTFGVMSTSRAAS